MSEKSPTQGWFVVGIGLILIGAAIYGLFMILGISLAIGAAASDAGAPIWGVLAIPGLIGLGFLVLLAKVVVDRLNNAEDDHYSKNIDK
ncbi:MAG: hypothetical protein L3J02_01055 [Henriciella sp.]|nr:hypothetical protein [Henriciella sp.]